MKKLIMTKGLPGSGKSTWALKVLADNPGAYKRVNKDSLRDLIDGGKWSRDNEKFILTVRDLIIHAALTAGKHVIVDDTNLAPKHESALRALANKSYGAAFEIQDFTDVPIETCIERDLKRPASVGEAVIRNMYNQFLAPTPPVIIPDPALPWCVIVDIDGTVALMNGRGPFDWHSVDTDLPNEPVCQLVRGINEKVIFVSGRDAVCRTLTLKWLCAQGLVLPGFDDLYMRPEGDMRDDRIVKEEIYRTRIEGKDNVRYVLDDRDKVVKFWRSIGLTCFQVAPGDF